ncbi:MAG: PAS domain-containing sensor histidine kinase [Desulfobacteraceae bacterium]|nr:MAG: PAS domain-containing sensor histidine kinase [Desulfobacteraceae bacterium]
MTGEVVIAPEKNWPDEPAGVIRGNQADLPLNVAFVGGGKACYDLLQMLDNERLSRLKMKILGVADIDPQAPGLVYAKKHKLFTCSNFQDLYSLKELNFIIELTGSTEVREAIRQTTPPEISLIGHRGARLLFDLVQVEIEKTEIEKKRQEHEEKEKKYTQIILDSLPYRIMVVNMDMTIEAVNQTFLNEFNFTYEDVLGKHCYEVRYGLEKSCGEAGHTCYLLYLEETKEQKIFSTIKEFRDEKGEDRFDVITIAPIYNEQGEFVQIVEASRDVTPRIKLEREVEKSNTFFETVIQSTVDGIVVVDTKGNVLIFNEGMERLTGYNAREIMERGHLASFYNIDVARENMMKMRSDEHGPVGKLNPTSMSITTKDGEDIPVTLSASIIKIDEKEVGSVGVFTDMREILKMRKDLEEAHFQLVQSEKIASVGKMAAGVAHEINNPLSGILMYAELLKESFIDNSQHFEDIQEIIDQTLRCKKIVSELLEFSRQTVGKTSSFSIEQVITKTLNLLINQALFQDIEVKKIIQSHMPEMVGDLGQLQQVFTNLFINAADAMKGKGRLDITAKYDTDSNQFTITVSDSGPGIPKELRDKIFDMFFTTKPVGKGTGLGLSISQKIINLHGGNILVDSPPEGGTRFIIELPLGFVEQPDEEPVFIGLDEA